MISTSELNLVWLPSVLYSGAVQKSAGILNRTRRIDANYSAIVNGCPVDLQQNGRISANNTVRNCVDRRLAGSFGYISRDNVIGYNEALRLRCVQGGRVYGGRWESRLGAAVLLGEYPYVLYWRAVSAASDTQRAPFPLAMETRYSEQKHLCVVCCCVSRLPTSWYLCPPASLPTKFTSALTHVPPSSFVCQPAVSLSKYIPTCETENFIICCQKFGNHMNSRNSSYLL